MVLSLHLHINRHGQNNVLIRLAHNKDLKSLVIYQDFLINLHGCMHQPQRIMKKQVLSTSRTHQPAVQRDSFHVNIQVLEARGLPLGPGMKTT